MTKFLNAAEEVFGKHGYEGTTIRAIAKKARVNLGTLQHYWGSKRELFRDLFERRFRPLQQEHMRRLRALEARVADGSRPEVQEVLRTLLEPTFFVDSATPLPLGPGMEPGEAEKRFHLLYGRALMDPAPSVIAEMTRIFEEPVELFLALMRRSCPHLAPAELDWRVNCIIGAQVFSQVYSERVGRYYGAEADVEGAVASKWILHFLVNGAGAAPCNDGAQSPAEIRANNARR
jgi:AcrR family transcriptional regulator